MKRAFTLMEVNLAILIMSGGILAMVSLYSLGYRENRQSREDVASAAIADAVLGPMVMACSATNLVWSEFRKPFYFPSEDGWAEYFDQSTGIVRENPQNKASGVVGDLMAQMKKCLEKGTTLDVSSPDLRAICNGTGMNCGIVVLHDQDSPIVKIAVRATHQPGMLLSMPMYYTEVRFQGDPGK